MDSWWKESNESTDAKQNKKKRKSLHSQKKRNTGLFEWHGEFKYKTVLERLFRNGPWRAECRIKKVRLLNSKAS